MNQENQETMNQNQNQTERNEPIYRFRNKTGFKDGTDYIDIQGDSITLVSLDGSRVTYNTGGLDRLQPSRQLAAEGNWTEEVIHPEPEQPKPMTIREAAKALKELPSEYHSKCFSVAVEINNEGKVRCKAMHDFNNFSGPNFESVLIQVKAAIAAKNSAPDSEADRIIDL